MKVSIIVTARNYGQYLGETLQSCLNQTVKSEVIYSDDFSTDNSVGIAAGFFVTTVTQTEHLGVAQARNAGAESATGNILIFVDGDDILPPDYVESILDVWTETTPFVYTSTEYFGNREMYRNAPAWDAQSIWRQNFVNSSFAVNRWAFDKVGGWHDTEFNTQWDYDFVLRLSKLGTPKKSTAVLNYRQHDTSNINTRKSEMGTKYSNAARGLREKHSRLSIGMVWSGRLSSNYYFHRWMESLVYDVTPLKKCELVIYNNSTDTLDVSRYSSIFDIKIITNPRKIKFTTEYQRKSAVCEFLADAYNVLMENMTGDVIHFREDDIMSDASAFDTCYDFVMQGNTACAGAYINRHQPSRYVGGHFTKLFANRCHGAQHINEITEPTQVDYTGTGFLFFWRVECPKYFKPYLNRTQAHDWAWCWDLKMSGKSLWLLPTSLHHMKNDFEWVEKQDKVECQVLLPEDELSKLLLN